MSSPSSSSSSYSYNSSLHVIATLLAFIFAFTITIHLILRLLARLSSTPTHSPSLNHLNSNNSTSSSTSALDPNRKSLIDSLPLFTHSSLPHLFSASCSICLSQFTADDKLRLLPACRHMFHSLCIDTWLKSTPSCPLCRSSVQIQHSKPPAETPVQGQGQEQGLAQAAEETTRVSWLKEYVDRLALSASSSFNSMRFSTLSPLSSMRLLPWGSRRFDGDVSGRMELGESFRSEESTGYFAYSFKWILEGAYTMAFPGQHGS